MSVTEPVRYGIDLGTTNSALAIARGEGVRVVKSKLQEEVTPSAVAFRKGPDGSVEAMVGKMAKQRSVTDPDRVATEFKRHMGDPNYGFTVPDLGVEESAPTLSSHVLRELKNSVALHGDLPPMRGAIVTVPAAFRDHQKSDTADAAVEAGLEWSDTLPEPYAAALAFGRKAETEHGPIWLAYDLGGGTFDAALVRGEGGAFSILDYAGDRFLGGKDMDEAIVQELILPQLTGEVRDLAADRDSSTWHALVRATEIAKCQLSVDEAALVEANVEGIPELWLKRSDIAPLEVQVFGKTLEICHKLLADNGYGSGDIERVIMVGGPTQSPTLRAMIDQGVDPADRERIAGLGIPIDCSVNPLTAVAEGAAVFAAGIRLPVGPSPSPNGAPSVSGDALVSVSLDVPAQVPDPSVFVAGRLIENGDDLVIRPGWRVEFTRVDPDGQILWESSVAVSDGAKFHGELALDDGVNLFRARVLDQDKALVETAAVAFEVYCGISSTDVARLTGIGVADANGRTQWLIKKGAPRDGVFDREFSTTVAIAKGQSDTALVIPIVEGEHDEARLNSIVAELRLNSNSSPNAIPEDARVNVTLTLGGGRPVVKATFPEFPGVEIESDVGGYEQPVALTRERLHTVLDNIALFEAVRESSLEIDVLLRDIERADLVGEIEEWLDLGSELNPSFWHKASDQVLELMRRLDPYYAEVDALQEWKAERAESDQNMEAAKDLVQEVGGQSDVWMAEFRRVVSDYDRAVARRADVSELESIAYGELPDLFRRSPQLAPYLGGGRHAAGTAQSVSKVKPDSGVL